MAREKVVRLDTAFLPGEIAHRNESERHHRLLHHTLVLRLCNGKGSNQVETGMGVWGMLPVLG